MLQSQVCSCSSWALQLGGCVTAAPSPPPAQESAEVLASQPAARRALIPLLLRMFCDERHWAQALAVLHHVLAMPEDASWAAPEALARGEQQPPPPPPQPQQPQHEPERGAAAALEAEAESPEGALPGDSTEAAAAPEAEAAAPEPEAEAAAAAPEPEAEAEPEARPATEVEVEPGEPPGVSGSGRACMAVGLAC